MPDLKRKIHHNGHKSGGLGTAAQQDIQKNIDTDDIFETGASFSGLNQDNVAKLFLESSAEFRTNLLRSDLKDQRKLLLAIRCAARYRRFNDTIHMEMLMDSLSGSRGINGRAIIDALQASSNVFSSDVALARLGETISKGQKKRMDEELEKQQERNARIASGGKD